MAVLLYESRQDIDKAIQHFKIAISEEANPTALFNLAVIFDERQERSEAKRLYQECLQRDMHNVQAKVNLAIILEKEGKVEEAFGYYLSAAE